MMRAVPGQFRPGKTSTFIVLTEILDLDALEVEGRKGAYMQVGKGFESLLRACDENRQHAEASREPNRRGSLLCSIDVVGLAHYYNKGWQTLITLSGKVTYIQ